MLGRLLSFVFLALMFFPVPAPALELTDGCLAALGQIDFRFPPSKDGGPEILVSTPTRLTDVVAEAKRRTDAAVASGEVPAGNSAAYRARLQSEVARLRAIARARERAADLIARGLLDENDHDAVQRAMTQLTARELANARRESVLFIDTPVLGSDGRPLNGDITLVVDHHGAYAPANGLDNSGAQVISRLLEAGRRHPGNIEAALREFRNSLFGDRPDRIVLSSDNLADAAEVIAILRSPELQRRILSSPEIAAMLTESGRFTDFFVFSGDGYETNSRSEQSLRAIALSKAIMHSHSELLRREGVPFGDRIVGITDPARQTALLNDAADAAERLLLTATSPGFRSGNLGRVGELAAAFDAWRGGPGVLRRPDGGPTSFADAFVKHQEFQGQLRGDLEAHLPAGDVAAAANAINRYTFGHRPVSTGHQFADWAASPMANVHNPAGRSPIKFEIGGTNPTDVGRPVILAKSGDRPVDLRPLGDALNARARQNLRARLTREGVPAAEIARRVENYNEFIARGTDLVFSFGGHSLTRAEITAIVATTLQSQGNTIVPGH